MIYKKIIKLNIKYIISHFIFAYLINLIIFYYSKNQLHPY